MKKLYFAILAVLLVSCAAQPSDALIKTSVAEAIAELPTQTPYPTYTPVRAKTNSPTSTVTPIQNVNELIRELESAITDDLATFDDVENVNKVSIDRAGITTIEVRSKWSSQDLMPGVAYQLVQYLALVFGSDNRESLERTFGKDPITELTIVSNSGSYQFVSTTNLDTFNLLANKKMSFDEWIAASNGHFK